MVERPFAAQFSPSIISFIDDPQLLGHSFEGESWSRWRAVLKAAFALPMTAIDLELFAEVSGGRKPPARRVKELICCVGRGGGKDSIASSLAVFIATTGDFSRLRPGERATVITMATDKEQASIAFEYCKGLLLQTPLLAALVEGKPSDRITLRTRAEIQVVTNNTRAPRGKTIPCAIYDEAAHWRSEDYYSSPDTEVDAAVSPGLMRFPGSLKIIISSVHRRSGLLYDKFSQHFGKDDDDVLVVLGTSLQFNPTLDQAEIERQLALDPEKAGAEYLSQWRDDLTNFLDRQLVEAAVDQFVTMRHCMPPHAYVMFVDPSGGRGDSFTAAVGHREGMTIIVDALFEKRAPFDSDQTIDEVAALAHQYNINTVHGDDYGADLTVAAFRRRGITYQNLKLGDVDGKQGKLSRSEIYLNSVGLFTSGRVRLLDNPRLVHQLISLERRAARSGHDTVDHPTGGHDDLANAACGCIVALAGQPGAIVFSPSLRSKIASMPQRNRLARFTQRKTIAMGPPSWR